MEEKADHFLLLPLCERCRNHLSQLGLEKSLPGPHHATDRLIPFVGIGVGTVARGCNGPWVQWRCNGQFTTVGRILMIRPPAILQGIGESAPATLPGSWDPQ
jgi:hypothetical protein